MTQYTRNSILAYYAGLSAASVVSVCGVWLWLFMGLSPVAGHLAIITFRLHPAWERHENSTIASVLVKSSEIVLPAPNQAIFGD